MAARAIILAQLHELATRYGKIPYFWLDMPHLTGWLAKDLSQQELYDSLKNVDADTIVMFNHTIQDGTEVKAFPTDVINGEMCQPLVQGHNPVRTMGGGGPAICPSNTNSVPGSAAMNCWGAGITRAQPGSPTEVESHLCPANRSRRNSCINASN